jgi:hypothetical protein
MSHEHTETGVIVTARADMMIRKPDKTICLLDLKTSKPDGGGKAFLPQYEVQVIGYSWVTEQAGVGAVSAAGLVYCDIQVDRLKESPMKYKTSTGIIVPFDFKIHKVKLDFSRLTKCLKEVKKVWNAERPPRGTDGCKDCQLLTRLLGADHEQRVTDYQVWNKFPEFRNYLMHQDQLRKLTQPTALQLEDILKEDTLKKVDLWDQDGGMWANWDFS